MTNLFRTTLAVLALALVPFSSMAQGADDGRSFDEQLADQIDTACGGGDADGCAALLDQVPANSPLQERAVTAAVNSGMSDEQVVAVTTRAKLNPAQAARITVVAVTRNRTAPAVTTAITAATTATGGTGGGTGGGGDQGDTPSDEDADQNGSGVGVDEDNDDEQDGSPG